VVLPDSHGIPRAPWYLGSFPEGLSCFEYEAVTLYGRPFQACSPTASPLWSIYNYSWKPRYPLCTTVAAFYMHKVWALPCSLAATWGIDAFLSLPRGTKMFQFPRLAPCTYVFSTGCLDITPGGFPHSGISGSMPACGSPELFAAYHALLRLLAPRHPPYALTSLTISLRRWVLRLSSLCSFQRTTSVF